MFSVTNSLKATVCAVNSSEFCSRGREPPTPRLTARIRSWLVQVTVWQPLAGGSVITGFVLCFQPRKAKNRAEAHLTPSVHFMAHSQGGLKTLSLLWPLPCLLMRMQKTLLFQVIREFSFFWGVVPVCANESLILGGTPH